MKNKKIHVISGGPGTGKTSILKELEKQGYSYIKEAAREYIKKGFDPKAKEFQPILVKHSIQAELENPTATFTDRRIIDSIAYNSYHKHKEKLKLPENIKSRYGKIFILEQLDSYENDSERFENKEEAKKVHEHIIQAYTSLGYTTIQVPHFNLPKKESIQKRITFILDNISK